MESSEEAEINTRYPDHVATSSAAGVKEARKGGGGGGEDCKRDGHKEERGRQKGVVVVYSW